VLTDYLALSVGGTLSVGGIGGTSYRHGLQTDHVLELEVVTCDGAVRTCTPDHEAELFNAVLAGLGQHGVITRATLGLVPAQTMVRRYLLSYPTATVLAADQRTLIHDGRFDYLEGQILPRDGQWQYLLEAATYYSPPDTPADDQLLTGLSDARRRAEVDDLSYLDFADRLAPGEAYLRTTGDWLGSHPWWNVLLPDSETDQFLKRLVTNLTVEELGINGLILVYPVHTAMLRTSLFRTPDEPVAFLVGMLRFTPPDPELVRKLVSANRTLYESARAVGGTAYQVGTIPFTEGDWAGHFGVAWPPFAAAKHRHDPQRILCPGQGIFQRDS
jgi:FAD/FMN-containing dehydrogenase